DSAAAFRARFAVAYAQKSIPQYGSSARAFGRLARSAAVHDMAANASSFTLALVVAFAAGPRNHSDPERFWHPLFWYQFMKADRRKAAPSGFSATSGINRPGSVRPGRPSLHVPHLRGRGRRGSVQPAGCGAPITPAPGAIRGEPHRLVFAERTN